MGRVRGGVRGGGKAEGERDSLKNCRQKKPPGTRLSRFTPALTYSCNGQPPSWPLRRRGGWGGGTVGKRACRLTSRNRGTSSSTLLKPRASPTFGPQSAAWSSLDGGLMLAKEGWSFRRGFYTPPPPRRDSSRTWKPPVAAPRNVPTRNSCRGTQEHANARCRDGLQPRDQRPRSAPRRAFIGKKPGSASPFPSPVSAEVLL